MPNRSRGRTATLRDGARVRLRPIAAEDKQLLAESFQRLSERSRYRRFLSSKARLSSAELAYLVDEVDHSDHEAIIALDPMTGAMLGIARYVRAAGEPETAEVAVTVADDWQGRGLGRVLLDRLTYRARREGIRRFTALVLGENRPALGLLAELGETVRRRSAAEVELLIELPPERGIGAQLARALRVAATGGIVPARTLAERVAAGSGAPPPTHPAGSIAVILVGLGERWAEDPTLPMAAGLAQTLAASLHLLRAYPSETARTAAEADLAKARDRAEALGCEVGLHPRRDEPADAILAAARELEADLLVVGGTSMGARILHGGVANRVSHRARCSVLIVRGGAAPAGAAG